MIEENAIIDQPNQTLMKQRSLINKYEIPIDHLSFEHIAGCKDIKELERIVRILRSGEEGYYPELQKSAEERLRSLSPNNRHLRNEEPVLRRSSMNKEEWNDITTDISMWKNEIALRDLRLTEENNNTMDEIALPPIRQPPSSTCVADKKSAENKAKSKWVNNYAAWDKYDADTELLKMDLEEEKEKEEKKKRKKEELQKKEAQEEADRLEVVVRETSKYSDTERQVMAEQEKNRGNEYYQTKDYAEAVRYYSTSIAIWPSAKAYNNRAACYLNQCKFTAALEDVNSTLRLEPENVKALFRRGVALQHKNRFKEALDDMKAVLRQEPTNILAQHYCLDLQKHIKSMPSTIRVVEDNWPDMKVREINTKDLKRNSLSGNVYEVNEWGLAKVMCGDNGIPRFLQPDHRCSATPALPAPRPPPAACAKIVELTDEVQPQPPAKLEIVEVQKLDHSEEFRKPAKCVVVDKRTQKNVNEGINVVNESDTHLIKTKSITPSSSTSADSGMDEDFELNSPLLGDSSKSIVNPPS